MLSRSTRLNRAVLFGFMLAGMAACSAQESRLLIALPPDGTCPVELVGWAAVEGAGVTTTLGGGDAPPQRATSIDELRKLAGDAAPRVIELSGTLATGTEPLLVTSDKTLVGVEADATLHGGIRMENASNVIIRNLHIQGAGDGSAPADGIEVRSSHHLWFDHLSIRDAPDGLLDATSGSDYVTLSWSKFWYSDPDHSHRLACLVGGNTTDASSDTGKNNVTFHHNWFTDGVAQYMPRILFGRGHVFNSYYHAPGNRYCIGVGALASVLVENNYFQDVNAAHEFQYTSPTSITATGNVYDNTTGAQHTGLGGDGSAEVVPFTSPPYTYTLDDGAAVPEIVMQCSGPQ